MPMICRRCGKEIPDESVFCAHCGCDLRKAPSSNRNRSSEDQVPLVLLVRKVMEHKIAAIVTVIVVALAIGGHIAYKKYQAKEKAEEALKAEIEHIASIIGTYKNSNITLRLFGDNTASITYKEKGWNERTRKGYWREKFNNLIEIDFSKGLEDIYIGSSKRYYCSTLYLTGTTLWESMSAYNSQDYSACEILNKE